ncbi:MAG TPA: DUF4920 domain-containing protein [Thermoanaerobaculia bacterium]|jgi:hypothetical protein|nr:DUF4920 domain-containing protein [Thermoanaerobaculia bacterium]
MKRLTIALLLVASTAFAAETITRGAAISRDAKSVPLAQVVANPDAYVKDAVVVEATVTNACDRKGCWMQLTADGAPNMRVTFKDYAFFVPLDSKGMKARAEGVTVVKTLSKKDADHLESEGAKLNRNADGTAKEVSFVASGVELTK